MTRVLVFAALVVLVALALRRKPTVRPFPTTWDEGWDLSELSYGDLTSIQAMMEHAERVNGPFPIGLDAQSEALLSACEARGITSPFDLEIALGDVALEAGSLPSWPSVRVGWDRVCGAVEPGPITVGVAHTCDAAAGHLGEHEW